MRHVAAMASAVFLLAMTGCGSDGWGSGRMKAEEEACAGWCHLMECSDAGQASQDSDCMDTCSAMLLTQQHSPAYLVECYDALLDLYACWGTIPCESIRDGSADLEKSCAAENAALEQFCGEHVDMGVD